jgi:hypothetical protein
MGKNFNHEIRIERNESAEVEKKLIKSNYMQAKDKFKYY